MLQDGAVTDAAVADEVDVFAGVARAVNQARFLAQFENPQGLLG